MKSQVLNGALGDPGAFLTVITSYTPHLRTETINLEGPNGMICWFQCPVYVGIKRGAILFVCIWFSDSIKPK